MPIHLTVEDVSCHKHVAANPAVPLVFQHPDTCKVYHHWECCDHRLVEKECALACPMSKSSATRSLRAR